MANYSAELNKATASVTIGVGALEQPGSGMVRARIYYWRFGSEANAADNALLFRFTRTSAVSTMTAVTPAPLDAADPASTTIAGDEMTVEGAQGVVLDSIPMNQRATVSWYAPPGGELVMAAVANEGILLETPVAQNTPAVTASIHFSE